MARQLTIDLERDYVLVRCTGVLDFTGIRAAGIAFTQLEGYHPLMSALWDVRDADLRNFDTPQMRELVGVINRVPGRVGAKVAMVATRDVDYGIMRMWQVYGEDAPQQRCVFRTMEEAQAWLQQ